MMKITKREILFSLVIISVLAILGIAISSEISNSHRDAVQKYELALKADNDPEIFQYAIRSHVGDVLASGTYQTINPVSFEEFGLSCLEIKG